MYRKRDRDQLTLEHFLLPFGGKLSADNRWVKLAQLMPWDFIEDIYAAQFSADSGVPAISARIAFGACYIKENENLSDERTLEYIAENPYAQYFLGLGEFRSERLFDPSMMTHFRKRFPADKVEQINKRIFAAQTDGSGDDAGDDPPENRGKLVLDATCAPSDIRYPGDLSLLNEARENTEQMLEELYEMHKISGRRTRYSRKKARARYLSIAKQKRPKPARLKQVIGQQIGYIAGNLDTIDKLLEGTDTTVFPAKRSARLDTIRKLLAQQKEMFEMGTRKCENRIVSLRQPHVRPIVRGKAGQRYEFGQKLALSVIDGYTFIEKQQFDNFNEGITLIESAERYKRQYGCYPEVIQADRIYRNRDNLSWCKAHGIRLSGPRLGRPGKDAERDRGLELQDNRERNIIEGRNGLAKRRFGLNLIMAYLEETAMTEAAFKLLCMNARIRILLRRFLHSWQMLECSKCPRGFAGAFQ